jgi:hypothetical protein
LTHEAVQNLERDQTAARRLAKALLGCLRCAQQRVDLERSTIRLSWVEQQVPLELELGLTEVVLSASVPGAEGEFFLAYLDDDLADAPRSDAWTEQEQPLFVSRYCRFQSEATSQEAARFATLPAPHRASLIALCETHRGYVELENEVLKLQLGRVEAHDTPAALLRDTAALAHVALALPRDFRASQPVALETYSCDYCRAVVFLPDTASTCSRCGAARRTTSTGP